MQSHIRPCAQGIFVDLDGFEPSTSSMPFKKYQSLTGILTRNKRFSKRRFGRQWTPHGDFWGVWTLSDSRTRHGLSQTLNSLERWPLDRATRRLSQRGLLPLTVVLDLVMAP